MSSKRVSRRHRWPNRHALIAAQRENFAFWSGSIGETEEEIQAAFDIRMGWLNQDLETSSKQSKDQNPRWSCFPGAFTQPGTVQAIAIPLNQPGQEIRLADVGGHFKGAEAESPWDWPPAGVPAYWKEGFTHGQVHRPSGSNLDWLFTAGDNGLNCHWFDSSTRRWKRWRLGPWLEPDEAMNMPPRNGNFVVGRVEADPAAYVASIEAGNSLSFYTRPKPGSFEWARHDFEFLDFAEISSWGPAQSITSTDIDGDGDGEIRIGFGDSHSPKGWPLDLVIKVVDRAQGKLTRLSGHQTKGSAIFS